MGSAHRHTHIASKNSSSSHKKPTTATATTNKRIPERGEREEGGGN